jgi:endoglucanase
VRTSIRAWVVTGSALAIAAGLASGAAASAASSAAKAARVPIEVRVNQVGYATTGDKLAYAMLPAKVSKVTFELACMTCAEFFASTSSDYVGSWNSRYRAVYALHFTQVKTPGTYQITVIADGTKAGSPLFRIGPPQALYHQLVLNAVRYFTSERDGPDVVHSVLNREPANLTDEHAYVYASPRYDSNDNLLSTFHKIAGPVNVAGGWFDAGGGYEKFAYTASYADGLMLMAARDFRGEYSTLLPEATYGLQWLEKLWNPAKKVLYIQVGIGNGNASNTIQGDYNFWFLPQAEDRMNVKKGGNPGPTAYYVKYRPVFEAAPPGQKISPEFAGRFAADFALAAQLDARTDRPEAEHLLALARGIYAMAKTTKVGQIVTTYPYDYYPGTEWKSDMLWGAAEMALADEALHLPSAQLSADLTVAARWARAYIAQGHPVGGDTLNLYDNGALGEAELLQAMLEAQHRFGGHGRYGASIRPVIAPSALLADMAAQLRLGESNAKGDAFGLGTTLGPSDATPHAFGLYITNALYQHYGGSDAYQAFAQQQLNFALGANGWGSSFTVGAGDTFPRCMQSEIANLAGSLTGKGDIQLGATTDGPSSLSNFIGLGTVTGMRACSAGNYKPFNTKTAGYEDNVVSWPSVEPADDYTANSLLAFALAAVSR